MHAAASAAHRRFLLGALPAVGLLGLVLDVSALTALGLVGGALLARAFWLARRPLRRLAVHRRLYPSAFEDDAVAVELDLENRGRRAVHLVEIADSFGPAMADRQLLIEPGPLHGRRRRRLVYRTACSRSWGVYGVGPLSLRTADPMGLFEARRAFPELEPFAVFPRVWDVRGIERWGARPTAAPQEATLARPGQSQLYLGVRDYRPGDDLRRVHWPATARRGAPVVKEHEQDLLPYFSVFVDLEARQRAGTGLKSTFEYVVRAAACLVWSALGRGDTVQLFGEGEAELLVPPGRGELHLAHCLYELIRARQRGTTGILDLVERHRPRLPPGSTVAVVAATISLDEGRLAELLESLQAQTVRPLLVLVNKESFLPIDRHALPEDEARGRIEGLQALLRDRGIPGAVLDRERELADELGRVDLFEASA